MRDEHGRAQCYGDPASYFEEQRLGCAGGITTRLDIDLTNVMKTIAFVHNKTASAYYNRMRQAFCPPEVSFQFEQLIIVTEESSLTHTVGSRF